MVFGECIFEENARIVPNFGDDLMYRHMPAIPGTVKADHTASEVESNLKPVTESASEKVEKRDILVAGSLAIDLSCDYSPLAGESTTTTTPVPQTSNPAVIGQSLGGVGHNVAIAASRVGSSVLFCSVVGDDLSGRAALSALQAENLATKGVQMLSASSGRTAQYVAINDTKKDLVMAMADMGIMELPEDKLDFDVLWEPMINRTKPRWVVVDANWSPAVLAKWIALAKKYGVRVAFEPVSIAKSRRLLAAIRDSDAVPNNTVSLAAPNQLELSAMYMAARERGLLESDNWFDVIDAMGISSSGSRERLVFMTSADLVDQGIPQQSIQLLPYVPCIITKLGVQGVLLTQLLRAGDPRLTSPEASPYILSRGIGSDLIGGVYIRHFPPAAVLEQGDIISVNGAGDTLLGVIVAGLAKGAVGGQVEDVLPIAQEASLRTLKSAGGVSDDLGGLGL